MSVLLLTGCVVSRNPQADNFKNLTVGMSKSEVEYWIGPPELYLSVIRTSQGIEEVLQYRNIYNEVFALEYFNDYLVSANYIYSGSWYPMYPPVNYPGFGRPVFPPGYRPNRPAPRPPGWANPKPPVNPRPPAEVRPPSNSGGGNTRPPASTRPGSNTRPSGSTRESSQSRESTGSSSIRQGTTTRENSGSSESTSRGTNSSSSSRNRSN